MLKRRRSFVVMTLGLGLDMFSKGGIIIINSDQQVAKYYYKVQ